MPRSSLAHESIGSMSESEDLSHYSDAESILADVESVNGPSFSDQTLLKQAFSGSVHSRKYTAKDWRHERESQFKEDTAAPEENDSKKADKGRSYSSRIRGFVQKMAYVCKKSTCTGQITTT
jgi:hypothetical protein